MGVTGIGTTVLLLIFGIVLTIITIRRMITGRISLPKWGKVMLSVAMIGWLLFLILCILPPVEVDNIFVNEYTDVITPVESIDK